MQTAQQLLAELLERQIVPVQEITESKGLRSGAMSRTLPLAYLAPGIGTEILEGHQPASLSTKRLREPRDHPIDWPEQRLFNANTLPLED